MEEKTKAILDLLKEGRSSKRSLSGLKRAVRALQTLGVWGNDAARVLFELECCEANGEMYSADPPAFQAIIDSVVKS